jgi:tRNA C32,U32 (ribose-2'-O)-methylase TrmJ
MPRSFAKYLRTLSDDQLLGLRRRAAAEIANRKAHEARNRQQAVRKWSDLAKEAGVTERELKVLLGVGGEGET